MGRLRLERSPYYGFLLEDPNFKRWVTSVEEGSPNTAACYFRRVGKISTDLNKKPRELTAMNKREAKVFIQDVIAHHTRECNELREKAKGRRVPGSNPAGPATARVQTLRCSSNFLGWIEAYDYYAGFGI